MPEGEDVSLAAPSLFELSSAVAGQNLGVLQSVGALEVHLPSSVSSALYRNTRPPHGAARKKEMLRCFVDAARFPLARMDLSGCELDDHLLVDLLSAHHKELVHLNLSNVTGLTPQWQRLLQKLAIIFHNLTSIRATSAEVIAGYPKPRRNRKPGTYGVDGRAVPVLGEADLLGKAAEAIQAGAGCSSSDEEMEGFDWEVIEFLSLAARCPHLTELNLAKDPKKEGHARILEEDPPPVETSNDVLTRILEPLAYLTSLDLSHWSRLEDLRCLRGSTEMLTHLILFDVPDLYKAIDNICELKNLRVLDVSQCIRESGTYPRPASCLYKLATSLRHLVHLDISSTNLAAQPSHDDWPNKDGQSVMDCDIYGLRFLTQPLQFLGLFNCDNASHFASLPAVNVSGDASEDQVINALRAYAGRAGLLQAVLNESYQLYRFGNNKPLTRHTEALHLVLQAMADHISDSTLQIAGSASLFYIIRKVQMNRDTKKRVVGALLTGMENHMEEQVMVRNCCLSLCQFEIPQEILFDYSRLAQLLVSVLRQHNGDSLTQRIVVFLLNSMACHVEGDQKIQVGSFGAIEIILEQIQRKLNANQCDDVMEVGWSFLWNITDETPLNCDRFLKAEGLRLFENCFSAFRTERELVRNMMGLIGNIAEVDELRPKLMNDSYIKIFCELLKLVDESIEISYNSAGVLAHMASDGDEAWQAVDASRELVMDQIFQSTLKWKLDTRRFINYRSFRPILRLIPQHHAYASQHWAVWALANLTTTDLKKYCSYVVDEGGEQLLLQLVDYEPAREETKILARTVLCNINKWRQQPCSGSRDSDSDSASMEIE